MSKAFYIADKLCYWTSNLGGHAATVHQLYTIGSDERDFFAAQCSEARHLLQLMSVRPSVRSSVCRSIYYMSVTLVIHAETVHGIEIFHTVR